MASRLSARSKQPCHAAFPAAGIRDKGICCLPFPAPRPVCTQQGSLAFLWAPAPLLAYDEYSGCLLPYINFSSLLCLCLQPYKLPEASSQQKVPLHASHCIEQWCSPVLGLKTLMFPFAALWKTNCFHATICTRDQVIPCLQQSHIWAYTQRAVYSCLRLAPLGHPAASPARYFPQHQGWMTERGCIAWHAQASLPAGTSLLPAITALSTVPGATETAGWRKGHVTPHAYRSESNPVLGLANSSEQAQQKAPSVLWLGSPKLVAKSPQPNHFQGKCAGCALCLLQLCWLAFAGSSMMAAPSCVDLFPPLSCL